MEWMLRDDTRPGTFINELDLARKFGVATTSIREFLNRFQRFGLIEKRPSGGWVLKGFTPDFALELFEIREMFELRSARAMASLPGASPIWGQLAALRREHEALLEEIDARYHDFSDLDSRFHRLINAAAPNRFIDGFYDVITLIFHYHYQWNKRDERQRNEVGDTRAPRLYRRAGRPEHRAHRARLPDAPRLRPPYAHPLHLGTRAHRDGAVRRAMDGRGASRTSSARPLRQPPAHARPCTAAIRSHRGRMAAISML